MTEKRYDNIIVGGGFAGLLTAGYLAKDGQSVLLLERGAQVGGRCEIYEMEGPSGDKFKCTMHGPTWDTTWNGGFWAKAARDLDMNLKIHKNQTTRVYILGTKMFKPGVPAMWTAEALADYVQTMVHVEYTPELRVIFKKVFKDMLDIPWQDLGTKLDTVKYSDWILERTDNKEVHRVLSAMVSNFMMMDASRVWEIGSAGKAIGQLRMWLVGEGALGFPFPNVYEGLITQLENKIKEFGGEIRLRNNVKEVLIQDGKAVGVRVIDEKGEEQIIYSGRVVVDVLFKDIPKLFKELPEEYTEIINNLATTEHADMFIFAGLKYPVATRGDFNVVIDPKTGSLVGHIAVPNLQSPQNKYCPDNKQVIWMEKVYSAKDFDAKTLEEKTADMNAIVEEIFPGYMEAIEIQKVTYHRPLWHHQYAAFKKIPQVATFAENLYFTGDCTENNLAASMDGVAASAMTLSEILTGKKICR